MTKASMDMVHLTLLLILSISFNLVSADDKLIQLQCRQGEFYTTCIQCVESNPQSRSADKVGIASIVIGCMTNKAQTLTTNMSTIASTTQNKKVKLVTQACTKSFAGAGTNLTRATDELKKKDYDQTNSGIYMATRQEFDCRKQVLQLKQSFFHETVMEEMLYEMRVFEQLSNAAMRMIDRF